MNVDLQVSRFTWAGSAAEIAPGIRRLARTAEDLGMRAFSFLDHYFQRDLVAPAEDPMLEGYTSLGYVAACTNRVKLRLLVTGATYRHPGLLAKIIATLDVLSGGRAELGIGLGWYEREHLALGVPFPPVAERFVRLEETLQICLQMWGPDEGPYHGKHHRLEQTMCHPAPISSPRPRILIGGGGERKTLRLVAKYADACNLVGTPDVLVRKIDVLRGHCESVGRDPNEIDVTVVCQNLSPTPDPGRTLRDAEALASIGVSTMITGAVGNDPVGWLTATFQPIIEQVRCIEPMRR